MVVTEEEWEAFCWLAKDCSSEMTVVSTTLCNVVDYSGLDHTTTAKVVCNPKTFFQTIVIVEFRAHLFS